jgi:hypothetical protein
MALTKVASASLLAITSITSNNLAFGSVIDVSTYYGVDVRIRMGRGTGSAFTTAPIFRLEGAYVNATPTADQWVVLQQFAPALGASIGAQAASSGGSAGTNTITLAAGTNFAAGDYVFLHNGTLGSSEWARVFSVSSATLTFEENLGSTQTSSTVRNQAEQYHCVLDTTGLYRLRLVVDAHATGQAMVAQADFAAVTGL